MEPGDAEPTAVGAVAVVVQLEECGPGGGPLLALELLAEATVGLLRVEHVQDVPPELPQLLRVVRTREVHQHGLGPRRTRRVRRDGLRGQLPHRRGHHPRLLQVEVTSRQRGTRQPEIVVQRRGQPHIRVRRSHRTAGLGGQPSSGRGRGRVGGDVVAVARGQQPHQELVEPGPGPRQLHQRRPLLTARGRPGRHLGQRVQRRVQLAREHRDRVPVGGLNGAGHGPILAGHTPRFERVFESVDERQDAR